MKKISLVLVLVASFFIPSILSAQALSMAYVDIQKIMIESDKGKEAKNSLTGEFEKIKKELESKHSELQKMKDAIEKQGTTITADARAEKEKQYQSKLKDFQRLQNDYQGELQQKDAELSQKIMKDLQEIIKTIGERDKYTIIFEKNQVLYISPAIDITGKVISLYNETAKKKPVKK